MCGIFSINKSDEFFFREPAHTFIFVYFFLPLFFTQTNSDCSKSCKYPAKFFFFFTYWRIFPTNFFELFHFTRFTLSLACVCLLIDFTLYSLHTPFRVEKITRNFLRYFFSLSSIKILSLKFLNFLTLLEAKDQPTSMQRIAVLWHRAGAG